MSHQSKPSLVYQIEAALTDKLRIGESKHTAKRNGTAQDGIYSWATFRAYMKHCNYFAAYCKQAHGCKTLDDCRPHVNEWLQSRFDLSSWTVKLEASALAKLYGCRTTDFISTPSRHWEEITRSRGAKARDAHFSEARHPDLVAFCRSTGLRASELRALRGDKLIFRNGLPYILVDSGSKGGKVREAPVIGDKEKVVAMMRTAGKGKVFPKLPAAADIHGYRAEYAAAIYKANARDRAACEKEDFYSPQHQNGRGRPRGGLDRDSVYRFRSPAMKGRWLDKQAMLAASRALGHNRIDVFAKHYSHFLL